MKLKNNLLVVFLLLLPSFFIFRSLYSTLPLVAGDAPHFLDVEGHELYGEPTVWTNRGENMGGVDTRIFISPILVAIGILSQIGLSHSLIIRLLFFFPALLLSLCGSYLLARHFRLHKTGQFIASFVYTYNTYFILLIDGGQAGIALAYGLFPFAVLWVLRLLNTFTLNRFILSLLIIQITIIADPRVAIIVGMLVALLCVVNIYADKERFSNSPSTKFKVITGFLVALIGLNAYWLYPLLKVSATSTPTTSVNLLFTSLLNGLTLYQPHWPENIFGLVTQPPFLFWGITILIFLGFVLNMKSKKYYSLIVVYLVFVFLAKGTNAPLGDVYSFLVNALPLGSAFRDSSKFFIPLTLMGGLIIGIVADYLREKYSAKVFPSAIIIYLLIIVSPSIMKEHHFVLSTNQDYTSIEMVNTAIEADEAISRSAWFPERHPYVFETKSHPALDAKSLTSLRPLANLTTGTSDMFNYIHQGTEFLDWYRIFGIRHLVFSGDMRNPNLDEDNKKEWDRLVARIDEIEGLERLSGDVPHYVLSDSYPQIVGVEKLYLVVGPMLNANLQTLPAVYIEDGKFDIDQLEKVSSDAATIIFNNRDMDDLSMSMLKEYYEEDSLSETQWGFFSTEQYLESKYQLLIRGVKSAEFDYGHGLYLSDNPSETLEYRLDVHEHADYVLAIRSMGGEYSKISYKIENHADDIANICIALEDESECSGTFGWYTKGISLTKGKHALRIVNEAGVNAINTVALVPVSAWNEAEKKGKELLEHFGENDLSGSMLEIDYLSIDTSKKYNWWYDIDTVPDNVRWIVLSESYHPDWNLKRGVQFFDSLPIYSSLNAFYIEPSFTDVSLRFNGQEAFRRGVWFTILTITLLILFYLIYGGRSDKSRKAKI